MKAIIVFLIMCVALLVCIVVVGALLPKSHVARRQAEYSRPPEAIWAAITDYKSFPQWRRDVRSVDELPPANGHPSWRERGANGDIPYEVMESRPPQRLVTRIADPRLPFGGTWTYEIAPLSGGGAMLTITENGEVYNPVFRFVSKFIMGQNVTIDRYLRALGRKFGEETESRAVR